MRQSGALALLLKGAEEACTGGTANGADGGTDAPAAAGDEQELLAARLVLVGPPPVLRSARELVFAWLHAEGRE